MYGRAVAHARSISIVWMVLAGTALVAGAQPELTAGPPPSDAEVFAQVFERAPGTERAPVLLVVDGVAGSMIVVELPPAGASPRAPVAPIVAALGPRLGTAAARRLAAVTRAPLVAIDDLRAAGLEVTYDPRALELRIEVPPALGGTTTHDLHSREPPEAAGARRRSEVSGYLNVRAGVGATWASAEGAAPASPVHAGVDLAINVDGWVVEGRADVLDDLSRSVLALHRGDVVVSHDVPARALRYLAGDLAVPAGGAQPSFPVLGLGVVRNFALQPYHLVQPVGTFDFVLQRPAVVTVLVNGTPVQRLSLAAGRHDVRDLPLNAGVNDVELVIREDTGAEHRLAFEAASPAALLAPGIVQFSLVAGFPLLRDTGLRAYDFAHPTVSGRRRWGVSPLLTVGSSADLRSDLARAGGELTLATTFGNLSIDASASADRDAGAGHAESLRYDFARAVRGSVDTLTVVGRHASPGFRVIELAPTGIHYADELALSTSLGLPRRTTGRLDLRYQRGAEVPDASEVSLALNRSFGRLGVSALVSTRHDGLARADTRVFVTAQWVLPDHEGMMHAASRASTRGGLSNEITYATHAGAPPGGLIASVSAKESSTEVEAAGGLDYTGERFTSSLATATLLTRGRGEVVQTASFEAATALAFAGGRAAWSRPITGSFAIVERDRTLDGVQLELNPVQGGHAAVTDSAGLAVIPNLEPYRVNRLTVEAPALPLGRSIGPGSYAVLPSYKSGTLIHVGEPGTVFLRGTLVGRGGAALAFVAGEIRSLDHRARPPITLFTNRAGRFSAMGITPGRYRIQVAGPTGSSSDLLVPAGTTGVFSGGLIAMDVGAPARRGPSALPADAPAPAPVLVPSVARPAPARPLAALVAALVRLPGKPRTLAILRPESPRFPATEQALATALPTATVAGVGRTQLSTTSLELAQLSIECIDADVTCYAAVGRALDVEELLFARVTASPGNQVMVTVTWFAVDAMTKHEQSAVFASDGEAADHVAALVAGTLQP